MDKQLEDVKKSSEANLKKMFNQIFEKVKESGEMNPETLAEIEKECNKNFENGTSKEEKQMTAMEEMQKIHEATYQGLGGSFDVYVGNVNRAPEWWVKSNLEWAYRLIKQPSRIKRQIHLLQFIVLLKFNKL